MFMKHYFKMNEAGEAEGGGSESGTPAAGRGDTLMDAQFAAPAVAEQATLDAENAAAVGKEVSAEVVDDPDAEQIAAEKKKAALTIPKGVFDARNKKHRTENALLVERISELEAQAATSAAQVDVEATNAEIEALDEEYQNALDDGDSKRAREISREIRMKDRQVIEASVSHKTEQARTLAVEQFKVENLIGRLEEDFPQLDPDTEEYDQAMVDEVGLLRSGFEKNGMTSSAAIAKAVGYVFGNDAGAKTETGARGINKDTKGGRQVQKNIDAANKQPPKTDSLGMDSHKIGGGAGTSDNLTDAELEALPESTKQRMRGDFL
jgi:hypothetical protein